MTDIDWTEMFELGKRYLAARFSGQPVIDPEEISAATCAYLWERGVSFSAPYFLLACKHAAYRVSDRNRAYQRCLSRDDGDCFSGRDVGDMVAESLDIRRAFSQLSVANRRALSEVLTTSYYGGGNASRGRKALRKALGE